jgi:hypothetical protein
MVDALLEDMRWLEEIRLRTQPRREKEVTEVLLEMAESVHENKELESASVYCHQAEPGGFSLILSWYTASIPMRGSDTAMLILEGLKPLGLLDHTVMVEKGKIEKVGGKMKEVM